MAAKTASKVASKSLRKPSRKPSRGRKPSREGFIETLWKSAQAQIDDIARRIDAGNRDSAEAERDARATAALVKVLCALNDDASQGKDLRPKNLPPEENDDSPRDIDEFRRELARRMEEIASRRTDSVPGGADLA